jgi:Amt family ammonium transporter
MSAHKSLSRRLLWVTLVGVPFLVPVALAQQPAEDGAPAAYDGLGTLWVLLTAFLVFFMQAGFGIVEAGLIRAKTSANSLMKNRLDFCFASLGVWICGFGLMFGGANP